MLLKMIASGSRGNSYALIGDNEILLIEAGVSLLEVKKNIDFQISKVVGCLISHEHGDHAKYVADYEKAGIRLFKPYEGKKAANYGSFIVKTFDLVHDVPCYGFYIWNLEIGSLIYATDTEYIKWRFHEVNHILIEANHSSELLDRDSAKYEHQIRGHMSIETCKSFILENKSPVLRNVCLCHLSAENGDTERFKQVIRNVVEPDVNVTVAEKGLEVNLDLCPF